MTGITKIAASWTLVAVALMVCVLAALIAARPTTVAASAAPTATVVTASTVTPVDTPWG
jgi:hypothetical protein